jgi:hypothetical protein
MMRETHYIFDPAADLGGDIVVYTEKCSDGKAEILYCNVPPVHNADVVMLDSLIHVLQNTRDDMVKAEMIARNEKLTVKREI